VANALYKSKTNLAVDILSNMLLSEKHPMAMWQIAKCCQIRDERLRTALIKVLEDPSLPYKARASALESLGYQRNITDLEILTSTISSDYHDIVSCGAIRGISNIGGDSKHSFNILKSKLETNPSRNIKIALLQGLTNAALKQDNKFYVEECVEILKDNAVRGSDDATRKAAVSALVQTGVDVSSDIWESRVCYATQDITWLECQIDKMKTKGTEWKLRVEELEGRIRELEKKVSNC
jgi:HEAT repeat protein